MNQTPRPNKPMANSYIKKEKGEEIDCKAITVILMISKQFICFQFRKYLTEIESTNITFQ